MATDINSVVVSRRLTKDCAGNEKKIRFSIASTRRTKKDGQWTDATSYFDVLCFQTGLAQYLIKGTPVTVKGTLIQESWEKNGEKHHATYIIADQVMLAPKSRDNSKDYLSDYPSDFPRRDSPRRATKLTRRSMTMFRSEVRMYSLMYDTKNGTNVTVVTDGEVARACELEDVIFGKKNGRYRSWHDYSAMAIICKASQPHRLRTAKHSTRQSLNGSQTKWKRRFLTFPQRPFRSAPRDWK
jgi:Single-stranded DNA-binding protein